MSESVSTIKLHYEVHGSGDPVLCVHGFGANLYTWRHLIEPLSERHQLILVDLKGCGASPKPKDKKYSAEDHADLIYRLILELDLQRLTLIGNSFGGALALFLAIKLGEQSPSRLSTLVLIDPGAYREYVPPYLRLLRVPLLGTLMSYLCPPVIATRMVLRVAYYDPNKITSEQVESYAAPLREPGGRHALLETAKQIIPPRIDEITSRYKTIRVPTLILFGDHDRIVNPIVGDKLHAVMPHSKLHVLNQCGHIPQEEKPAETVALILEFLSARETSA